MVKDGMEKVIMEMEKLYYILKMVLEEEKNMVIIEN